MDYEHIIKYLEKFKVLVSKREDIYLLISDVIFENIKKRIEVKNINIKSVFLYLNVSPLVKSEILIKKKDILNTLNSKIKNKKILDIK